MSSNQTLSGTSETGRDKATWDHSEFNNNESSSGNSPRPQYQSQGTGISRPNIVRRKTKRVIGVVQPDGRRELQEEECHDKLGFSYPWAKKWYILTVVFLVQLSMNFNSSVYSSSVHQITAKYAVSEAAARCGQMIFLVSYAFGCELWAPWSEEYGRWPIMQLSLFFVNIWQIPAALSPNLGGLLVARFLGGLSSAGGSVTLGMCADMWESSDQGFAVAYVVLSSVGGSSLGPIFGGIIADKLDLQWNFWIQMIFGVVVQVLHLLTVPETRSSILIDKEAARRRKEGEDDNIYGPGTFRKGLSFNEVFTIWKRPFEMFLTEPIVLFLSLLSGFSDALIFICMESVPLVFVQWGFSSIAQGLIFCAIIIGYFIAYFLHLPDIARQLKILKTDGEAARLAERRLLLLLFLAPLEPIGLFGFAWTSFGPSHSPWIAPVIFLTLIAIANFSIYMSTIDYMVAAYGPYSASATGGNGFSRDLLAGIAAMYAGPMYKKMSPSHPYQWASTFLGLVAIVVAIPIYVFYWKGPEIRRRSKFAQTLAADKQLRREKSLRNFSEDEEEIEFDDLSPTPESSQPAHLA
ncbi:hypothetical protein PSN45_001209 [Yamadazyma tenuis]|uniref:Major facilitator superfamily (MFS) profile domain-containing protein n=1 Tax=Candida tenuis (strain ATCC 10573 / BCRC 21748 / CBS 615 / JCM 9827 / NBRC 10315 / NRRL Y-1498 / VKM Y-70) TaxID=590646 RepID=G3B934_CANTC|nr:uncharacterized protein CANTEDRAFT_126449 [Yamadazyma tenuis ATCC 10573]EGV62452.1 hypothetical protein CANTEDRAFT_126449 [Yamadazyma tenuis ATCC 10573]WEJ93736.1 hypothetical protein PSN45_001209 [Yamadazyma tenuis]